MWKNLSFKSQLILILLLPVSGLIYFTISNINNSYQKLSKIDKSIENIDKIAAFSEAITLINNERTLNEYSKFDLAKKVDFKLTMAKSTEWFSQLNSTDSIVTTSIGEARTILNIIHQNEENNTSISSLKTFKDYTDINNILNNLIEREIVNCENTNLAKLANNFKSYIETKTAANLIRAIVFHKLINNSVHSDLYGYYDNMRQINRNTDFKLDNYNSFQINDELIQFKNSTTFKSFLKTSDAILNNTATITPQVWWHTSTDVNKKINAIKTKKLNYIIKIAQQEKDNTVNSAIIAIVCLTLLLLLTTILVYKLITNTSNSLKTIATKIEKIALGYTDFQHILHGNIELDSIRESFKKLTNAIKEQINLATEISSGHFGETIKVRSEADVLNHSLNTMSLDLKRFNDEAVANSHLEQNIIEVNKTIIESKNIQNFGDNLSKILCSQTNSCQAVFYIIDYLKNNNNLIKVGSYADSSSPEAIALGEGLVGEAAKFDEQKCLNNLTKEYSFLSSSLGKSPVYNVLITPVSYKNAVIGVIEIGSLENFTETDQKLLITLKESLGNAIAVFIRNEELRISSEEIIHKNNILQVQEEELRQNNEELNKHTLLLQQSEEELKNQAAELEQTNAYLEEKSRELETKNYEIEKKNDDLVIAQEELNIKSEEIAQASKYKSEFLANMSHELRTPLNSILILSDLLKDNVSGNLTNAQLENLSVINTSGKDLLNLITDILDISKIEAGKVEIYPENTVSERIFSDMDGLFRAQMDKKNINFETKITDDCPREIYSDVGKIEQILKNFLSNALKFTPNGGTVAMTFDKPSDNKEFNNPKLAALTNNQILAIEIKDNGIGISEENKKKLFQSFQQADSSTSRKYGGTGLGLYISKQLADLLDGEVFFDSQLNNGSTFGVYIPIKYAGNSDNNTTNAPAATVTEAISTEQIESEYPKTNEEFIDLSANIQDDRHKADIDDKTILIIEDDPSFAEVLLQVAHNNGFKAIIAHQGETGFQYAKKYNPKAIILDMKLPGIDGWTVLKWLKEDAELKHIPVHVMSGMKREKLAKEMGAFDFLVKPITPEKLKNAFLAIDDEINKAFKRVLILEDDEKLNYAIKQLLHANDKNTICLQAYSRSEAENILSNVEIDCAIIDLGLPDSDNVKAISELKNCSKNKKIKIIINTGKTLSDTEQLELEKSADSIVIKTNNVTERLKDEILLFLNKIDTVENTEYKTAPNLSGGEILKDKNILIVDDDIRNIYALSAALTSKGAIITTAFNGIEALNALEEHPNFDIVLMDIMMPEMDGFEATKKIRENIKWKNLPIIALTAKAMKGDRDEIIKAGASDYQSKPIDIQKLISLISIWIYK